MKVTVDYGNGKDTTIAQVFKDCTYIATLPETDDPTLWVLKNKIFAVHPSHKPMTFCCDEKGYSKELTPYVTDMKGKEL